MVRQGETDTRREWAEETERGREKRSEQESERAKDNVL